MHFQGEKWFKGLPTAIRTKKTTDKLLKTCLDEISLL